jgi:multidrug efflux pump subunit AcrA (membrane-fusion protein)
VLIIGTAVVWMWKTHAEVVVHARGQLVVKGELVQITVPNAGLVVEVPVQVGQHVERDELLLRLDAFDHESEVRRISKDMEGLQLESARHREHAQGLIRIRPHSRPSGTLQPVRSI